MEGIANARKPAERLMAGAVRLHVAGILLHRPLKTLNADVIANKTTPTMVNLAAGHHGR